LIFFTLVEGEMGKINKKNKALFLDRDGVVNIDKNYVYRVEDIDFIDGIFEFCDYFQKKGYLIFIITNQAGIARGYYSVEDFRLLSDWMVSVFKERAITISKIYFCPHHPEITGPCNCRKPNPGMILKAAEEYDLDLSESILIGNHQSDILAGGNAGIIRNYLFNDPSDFKKVITAEKDRIETR
jgi:D-glycero-D-manno-heptose 1,7-bisphosphate phosphatase